jgi:hypothetical protein
MSISAFFEKLGAPLQNPRWSWGAIRKSDGAVFLRVWQDRKTVQNKSLFMMITHHCKYALRADNLGYQERLRHVERMREGAPCFMIMCCAVDPEGSPRKIKSYNESDIFVGGDLMEVCGDTWVLVVKRAPVGEIIAPAIASR